MVNETTVESRAGPVIRRIDGSEAGALVSALADILIDCVERGASVGFMAPLDRARAEAYWTGVANAVARDERILLVATDGGDGHVVGTVQVAFAAPENQPHRADISKLLVHGEARRQGLGAALMTAAEEAARGAGRRVLVLDTASGAAERLYERLGWTRVGVIPDYALLPDGRPCATTVFWKGSSAAERKEDVLSVSSGNRTWRPVRAE